MKGTGYECTGNIPGFVYSFLLDNELMEDPYFRQNELEALKLLENEITIIWHLVDPYIKKKDAEHPLLACTDALAGYGHI